MRVLERFLPFNSKTMINCSLKPDCCCCIKHLTGKIMRLGHQKQIHHSKYLTAEYSFGQIFSHTFMAY